MQLAGLYAGIGGFELAFREIGKPRLFAELAGSARTVLRHRFPDAEIVADVADISELPSDIDVVTAGFPCQNLSMAGDKAGISGTKSRDVVHLFSLIERSKPPIVVIENVYFMLHLDRGKAMEFLVGQFEKLGYRWAYRVLDTIGFGLPQRRRRVYLVASRIMDPQAALFPVAEASDPLLEVSLDRPVGFYWTEGRSGSGLTSDAVPPIKAGSGLGIPSAPAVLFPDGAVLTPDIESCERLQGFEAGWTSTANEHKRSPRWLLVGNSVSVPVARWVARRIVSPENPGVDYGVEIRNGSAWPNAAYGDGKVRFKVEADSRPQRSDWVPITEFRTDSWRPVSFRALRGFVTRAEAGTLRYPDGFLNKLRSAMEAIS
ncbi:DNA cytosine methyltransferase [Mesorhizobium carmichaelinearum]|uniref:DNA cytosine methyltransferase n=1 Tax=Mesorhizobium carmichaelinearum TaxID=1208188 RepID=UPI0015C88BE6|nr:DNA (cytosine-5-)-methyltransferase [Mesorhizobium carmichaelinearum]